MIESESERLNILEWCKDVSCFVLFNCLSSYYLFCPLSLSLCLYLSLSLLFLSLSDISFLSTIENTSFKSYALYCITLPKLNSIRYPFYLKFCSSSNYARMHWDPSFSEFFWFTFLTELSWSDIPLLESSLWISNSDSFSWTFSGTEGEKVGIEL